MNGSLAQAVALTAHGRMLIHQPPSDADDLTRTNSTFQYVSDVHFVDLSGSTHVGTAAWFGYLRKWEATALWLGMDRRPRDVPEHGRTAFAGAGPWLIRTDAAGGSLFWTPIWSAGRPHPPRQRAWSVEYRAWTGPGRPDLRIPLHRARGELVDAVRAAIEFARGTPLDGWRHCLDRAVALLDQKTAEIPFHPDMLPSSGYSPEARSLVAAAATAFVFGGMGSWNDVGFSDAEQARRYAQVSERLYDAVIRAILAATNSVDR